MPSSTLDKKWRMRVEKAQRDMRRLSSSRRRQCPPEIIERPDTSGPYDTLEEKRDHFATLDRLIDTYK